MEMQAGVERVAWTVNVQHLSYFSSDQVESGVCMRVNENKPETQRRVKADPNHKRHSTPGNSSRPEGRAMMRGQGVETRDKRDL